MKNFIVSMIIVSQFFAVNLRGNENPLIISGFEKYISGSEEDEDCSCTPDAVTAMTVRCIKDKDFIEWETSKIPDGFSGDKVSFVWSAGYSTGTKDDNTSFSLFVNNKQLFNFVTASHTEEGDWALNNSSSELSFRNMKFYNRSGNKKDFWGFFILTVPVSELTASGTLIIKIMGDATGSRHWLRTMELNLQPIVKLNAERIINKVESGKLIRRIKIVIDHYSYNTPVEMSMDGKKCISDSLKLGRNYFFVNTETNNSFQEKVVDIKTGGFSKKYKVSLEPVKEITLYLIPHSHVDIGYTDLQPEVEKKQWQNIDRAIKLSRISSQNPEGSVFKWNVEVLWAVKSYLETFPEKRTAFIDAVKKGWIGLDALYANLLTGLCRPEELYESLRFSNKLERETGIHIEDAMISDVPGYTWGLMQAFADNGIKYFSVGTNASDRMGNTLPQWGDKPFYWKTPSGKDKILVWFAGKGYSFFHHYSLEKDNLTPVIDYLEKLHIDNYPYNMVQMRYTIGDNKGPDSLLPDFVKQWNETHITPKFKIATTLEMFRDFENEYGAEIPEYSGDFTPYWEDGAASSARETALNRRTAEKLNQLEILYSLAGNNNFPVKDFEKAWDNVMLYSEHTWGAWNSISDPENDIVKKQWQIKSSFAFTADSITNKLAEDILMLKVSAESKTEFVTVWNTNSWARTDVVTIPAARPLISDCLFDDSGRQIPTQRLTNGDLVFIANSVPPLSSRQYHFVKENSDSKVINPNNRRADVIPETLKSVIASDSEYSFNEYIYTGTNAANPLTVLPGIPEQHEKGPVVNSYVYKSQAPGCNSLTREIRTYSGLDKINVINTIDKKKITEKENLRFVFPFNITNPVTHIDIAWSVIKPETDQLPAANKNYFTVQRWIDVSNEHHGITIAPVDAPFIELGGMTAEAWKMPARESWSEHTAPSSEIFSWIMNNSWNTNYKADQEGKVTFEYAFSVHNNFNYSKACRFGIEQSQPLMVAYGAQKEYRQNSFFIPDEKSPVVITSIKPSADGKGFIMRLYNPTNSESEVIINPKKTSAKVYLSNGKESEVGVLANKTVFTAFEVKTIKIITQ